MTQPITRIDTAGLKEFRQALQGMSRASAPGVRKVLAAELIEVRDAMRANAGQNMFQRTRGSDFKKSIKSFVFYRSKKDIDLSQVGGAAKAYGGFWIAHESGAVITRGADKWLLMILPEGVKEYGGKRRNKMPIGTIVRPIKGDMLGVFRPLKTKMKLIAILKKVVTLRARLNLVGVGTKSARNISRQLVKQIILGKVN